MLASYRNKVNIGMMLWLVMVIVAGIIVSRSPDETGKAFGQLLALCARGVLIFVGWCYSVGKGHDGAWGFLSLFGIWGFIPLVFFGDKHKKLATSSSVSSSQPTQGKSVSGT